MRRDSPTVQEPATRKRELDTETTTELFHRHAPSLFAYLRQHTACREDAEDLLHEVFAAALERPEVGLLSDSEQALWPWRVTRNKTVDSYRRKTHRPSLALDNVADELSAGDERSPEYAALRREEYAGLLAALGRLPAIQQEAPKRGFQAPKEQAVATAVKAIPVRARQVYTQPGDAKVEVYWNGQLVTTLHFVVEPKAQH